MCHCVNVKEGDVKTACVLILLDRYNFKKERKGEKNWQGQLSTGYIQKRAEKKNK